MPNALIIFVRNPELGKVKTRLAAVIGAEAALGIYCQLLLFTKKAAALALCKKYIFYADYINETDIWENESFSKQLQKGDSLGERMQDAFKTILKECGGSVQIIGSDCPLLTTEIINQGFELLKENDVVIGPSEDGGYYLLGMNSYYPEILNGISWSTAAVFSETMEKIKAEQLSLSTLPILSDVDTIKDWELLLPLLSKD